MQIADRDAEGNEATRCDDKICWLSFHLLCSNACNLTLLYLHLVRVKVRVRVRVRVRVKVVCFSLQVMYLTNLSVIN